MEKLGSGCGSVGRVVASDSRGPRFKSNYNEPIYCYLLLAVEYTKIKGKKMPGMAHLKK